MYEVESSINIVGAAQSAESSEELVSYLSQQAKKLDEIHTIKNSYTLGGSEDATYMMSRVQEKGGHAAYLVLGTKISAGHHNDQFDIDEKVMPIAVKMLALSAHHTGNFLKDDQSIDNLFKFGGEND